MSVVCPGCGETVPSGLRFCGLCGTALEQRCPSCGQSSPASFRFCGSCGASLQSSPEEPSSIADERPVVALEERKVVTVIFADLTSSTEVATRLDPEDLRSVIAPFFEAMSEEIGRLEGTVEKYIGDAVVAVFGVPAAHEDDPERAVRAALAMQARMPALNERLAETAGGDLALRIGVNTGEVLAAHRASNEGYVTGEVVNVAARLQTVADPGTVVVGERTRRATRSVISYRSLGEQQLKGLERPVPVWQALGEARQHTEFRELRSSMVGRDEEFDLLQLLFTRTLRRGRPDLVTVLGPPGIGKSRLAFEFTSSLQDDSVRIVRGRCLPYDGGLGYWPLAEILKGESGILDSDPPSAILAKARARLDPRFADTPDGLDTTQLLLSSIGIAGQSDPLVGVEPSAARRVLAGAWWRYFESLAAAGPLVAVIEDIHWADDQLLELIEFLADHVAAPLFLLCMARPELWERRSSWSAGLTNATTIGLAPLSSEDGSALIENLLGNAPGELVDQIMHRSEGNPFFTEELLRMLVEDGTLAERAGQWALTRELPPRLPDTVQGVLASRIDLLSATEKQAIQGAAVVGRSFWVGAVAGLGFSGVEAVLEGLLDKGLLRERDASTIAGEREFTFHHVLTRDVAYESIPRSRRANAHEVVLRWMEQTTGGRDEEFAEILSYHAERAGDLERTARYAMLAGHRQRRVFAAAEAIGWYDRALEATDELSSDASALLRVETALSRGAACEQLGRYAEARTDYERALEAARRRPAGSREWLEIRALAARVQALWKEDRYAEAEALLPEAIESAAAGGADDLVAQLWYAAGAMAHRKGDWDRARSSHLRALEVATAAGDLEDEALVRHGLAATGFFTGPFDEALSNALRAGELLRELGQRPMVHHTGATVAWLQWLTDDRDAAAAAAQSSLAGSRDVGNRLDEAIALSALAVVETSRGNLGGALRAADDAVAATIDVGSPRDELDARFWRLWPLAELRDARLFGEEISTAQEIAEGLESRLHLPALTAAQAWSRARAGETTEAEETFARARREAVGVELELLLVPFFELLCWEETGDGVQLAAACRRLQEAARGRSRAFAAWAYLGLALADFLAGDSDRASAGAAKAVQAAEAVSELPVVWRGGALLRQARAATAGADGGAATTDRAREILSRAVDGLEDEGARSRFLARSDVESVLGPAGGDRQA